MSTATMRALVVDGRRLRLQRARPVPRRRRDEARVRVLLAGICGTDLQILRGYAGFHGVLGHEFVGVVDRCGDRRWLGRRVVGDINVACQRCRECRAQRPRHCRRRRVLGLREHDGAFAEYLTLPIRNLVPVPESMADEVAVFAEPVAAALQVLEELDATQTERALVLGAGRLGLLVAQALKLRIPQVAVCGRTPRKLMVARQLKLQVATRPAQRGFDLVVDCTGSSDGFRAALELVRPCGTVIVKSTTHGATAVDLSALVVNEVRVVGSRCGRLEHALLALARGEVRVQPLLDRIVPLDEYASAWRQATTGLKVLLQP